MKKPILRYECNSCKNRYIVGYPDLFYCKDCLDIMCARCHMENHEYGPCDKCRNPKGYRRLMKYVVDTEDVREYL